MRTIKSQHRESAGFSLIELLIAMVISLFGIIAVTQVFAVSEQQKRIVTGGSSVQQNGSIALMTMERTLRMTGFGFNNPKVLGCNVRAHNTEDSRDFSFILAPVVIKQGTNGAPDELTAVHGAHGAVSVATSFAPVTGVPRLLLKNRAGYANGDVLVATGAGTDGGVPGDLVCSLSQVTALPDAPGETEMIVQDQGTYTNGAGQASAPIFNKPGGVGVSFSSSGLLFNLGEQPVMQRYSVKPLPSGLTQLIGTDLFTEKSSSIADDVIDLQAQYGIDTSGTGGLVSTFVDDLPLPITTDTWGKVLALRLAILVRSKHQEKPDASGACVATTAAPRWSAGQFQTAITTPGWRCYRYAVYETVVPLRNMLWKKS
jgi:type IV pilus assembly protein PilW